MPDSSFFDPMQIGGPGMFPGPGPSAPRQTPTFKAGYKNVYGTSANLGLNPVTKEASLDFRAPIGDYQNQMFLTGGGYATPSNPGSKADWGVRIGFEKKIAPQGTSMGELIDRSLGQAVGVQSAGGFSTDSRARMMEAMSPEDRERLFQDLKTAQRQSIDQQLGVIPGATKFGYNLGVDMKGAPEGMGHGGVNPASFARNYANSLMGNQ